MSELRTKRALEGVPPHPSNIFVIMGYVNELRGFPADRLSIDSDTKVLHHGSWSALLQGDLLAENDIICCHLYSNIAVQNLDAIAFYNPNHYKDFDQSVSAKIREHSQIWSIALNGIEIDSFDELLTEANQYISDENEALRWSNAVWDYSHFHDPEKYIEKWIDVEPVATGLLDFVKKEHQSSNPISVTAVAESNKPISTLILTSVVGALLRGGFSDHFQYLESGELVINAANPPTLEQSYEILRRTLEVKKTGNALENYSSWTLGMLGDNMDRQFGDIFDPSEVMEQTGKSYNTYITCLNVYRAMWANKKDNLTFTHHKEVFYSSIAAEDKDWVLDTASRLNLTVAEQRKLLSFIRVYGTEAMRESPPETSAEVVSRVETRSVNKNFLFFLPTENRWYSYRGPFEHIPNGASPILNADTKAKMGQDGTAESLEAWNPPGIEMPYIRGHAAAARNTAVEEAIEATQEAVVDLVTTPEPIEDFVFRDIDVSDRRIVAASNSEPPF